MSDDTTPLGGLPGADRSLLVRAPIELAVAEVRLLNDGTELPADAGLRLLELLSESGTKFTQLEVAQQNSFSIDFGPGAQPSPQIQKGARGWQVTDESGLVQVTVLPSTLAVQVQGKAYERWSVSLRPLLEVTLASAKQLMAPSAVGRIGLRYVDRFIDDKAIAASAWVGRIRDSLLGPICHDQLAPMIRGAQQQIELALGPSQGAILRHGPFLDQAASGSISYLLDVDVFDARPTTLDVEEVATRAEILNRTAAALFQMWMTPEYLRELQGKNSGDITGRAAGGAAASAQLFEESR